MAEKWEALVDRWAAAGVVDVETAARIRAFERTHDRSNRLTWPVRIALAFGALTLGAGALLFVAAHWDTMSPALRFTVVVLGVGVFHLGGAATAEKFPAMGTTLHTLGTVALGGGIYLAGQIFNLDEHWPGGLMLWSFGAALAWALLRSPTQLVLTALLAPAWLAGEWVVAIGEHPSNIGVHVVSAGAFLFALAYLAADDGARPSPERRALRWVGVVAVPIQALVLAAAASEWWHEAEPVTTLAVVGWLGAIGLPILVAAIARGVRGWPIAVAAVWVVVLVQLHPLREDYAPYAWWMLGATGLAAWGVAEARKDLINLGMAAFGITVMVFYFSHVMDMLARSTSLIGLGLTFLLGGWMIERVRRRLVLRIGV